MAAPEQQGCKEYTQCNPSMINIDERVEIETPSSLFMDGPRERLSTSNQIGDWQIYRAIRRACSSPSVLTS